jgi:hypothetical protein
MEEYISKREFKEVRTRLYSKGFRSNEIDEVEKIFMGDMYEEGEKHRGIDSGELERGIKWMRENKSKHKLSDGRIDELEKILEGKL